MFKSNRIGTQAIYKHASVQIVISTPTYTELESDYNIWIRQKPGILGINY